MQSTDEKYMKEAIKQAKKAYAIGEVPIGCVIVYQDKIIGRGYNRRTIDNNTLAHAELAAIRKASRKLNSGPATMIDILAHTDLLPKVPSPSSPSSSPSIIHDPPKGSSFHEYRVPPA